MSRNKLPRRRKIKHELFIECAKVEKSPYWKTIFTGCAYGDFPQGMTFKDNILYHRKARRKKPVTYSISTDPEKAAEELKAALKKEKNLIPIDELTQKRIRSKKKLKEITLPEDSHWGLVSKSTLTVNMIIATYIRETRKKLGLSLDEASQLKQCINRGLASGVISNDDIKMHRGEIVEIKGIKRLANGFFLIGRPETGTPVREYKSNRNQTRCDKGWLSFNVGYRNALNKSSL